MQPAKGYVRLFFRCARSGHARSYPELVSAYLDASTNAVALV